MAFAQTTDLAYKPTLSGADEQAQAASQLRQSVHASKPDVLKTPGSPEVPLPNPHQNTKPANFSSALRQIRATRQKSKAGSVGSEVIAAEAQAVSAGTSELLQQAWYNAVETFGLTLLYINVHVLGRWIFGEKFFCKLGHEWLGGKKSIKGPGAKQSGTGSIFGIAEDGLGLLEVAVLVIVDLIVAAIVLINFIELVFIAYVALHPVDALVSLGLGNFVDLVKAAFHL